ncbi:MAG: methyltransferase domain-containing protein [Firmicutes bacterium]|nr:methyltransferase domain-containing protein [Alicyclobacillaceae bacterium]MCL6497858.1 methyltransferase domain-containing protein [Bacillota bacterium]
MTQGALRDRFLLQHLTTVPDAHRWLLLQTAYTGEARRTALAALPFAPRSVIYDLGAGLGAMSLELAETFAAHVVAFDHDPVLLRAARTLADAIPPQAGTVEFREADITRLLPDIAPRPNAAVARFVLQHLPYPQQAVQTWSRLVEPGGYLWLEEVDDGLTVEFPPPPPAWERLIRAFAALQARRGGDREAGRKLAHWALLAGLRLVRVETVPWTAVRRQDRDDPALGFERRRIGDEAAAMVAAGLVTKEEVRQGLAALDAALPRTAFVTAATVRVLAQKP